LRAALEKDVGGALVTRMTRVATLTDVGNDYLTRVEAILASLEEADHAARGSRELRGSLRVAMPASFGVRETPADLAAHAAIVGPAGTSAGTWAFQKDGRSRSVRAAR
jgi:DNA-binding transcriptional LysR family regulator